VVHSWLNFGIKKGLPGSPVSQLYLLAFNFRQGLSVLSPGKIQNATTSICLLLYSYRSANLGMDLKRKSLD
tara:strand:+ start:1084 stop:1296 length:213 start_codon:yes stop_codon:yes gene_type:complete